MKVRALTHLYILPIFFLLTTQLTTYQALSSEKENSNLEINATVGKFTFIAEKKGKEEDIVTTSFWAEGTFTVAGGGFYAEALVTPPGTQTMERYSLLITTRESKVYLLYHDTFNYQEIRLTENIQRMFLELLPEIPTLTPSTLQKYAQKYRFEFEARGPAKLDKVSYSLYVLEKKKVQDDKMTNLTDGKAKFYFMHKNRFLRVIQFSRGNWSLTVKLSDIKGERVTQSRFEIPKGYYELEPLTLAQGNNSKGRIEK